MKKSIVKLLMVFSIACLAPACNSNTTTDNGSTAFGSAFVVTTDFETGSFAVIDSSTKQAAPNVGSISSDAVAKAYAGLVYVINRFGGDNIQTLDPANGYSTLRQFSVGAGSNPQDIAFANDTKAYVARYGSAELWIVNPQTGEKTGSLDLSEYADADGIPEMAQLYINGSKLYVGLQKLNQDAFFVPTGDSEILVFDTNTALLLNRIKLPVQNPTGFFIKLANGNLAIACAGAFGVTDGAIALINTDSDTASILINEADLGGDINNIVMTSNTSGYAVIGDSSFNTALKKFETSTGAVSTILTTDGFNLAGIALDEGELWVSDRTATKPGVRIFDSATGASITDNPVNTGLPPFMILFI